MADNKYGLDFKVWGNTSAKSAEKEPEPLKSINKGWGSSSKAAPAETDATYVELTAIKEPQKSTCTIKKATFIPDKNTSFNKPCRIKIELEGEPKGPLKVALWATYKGIDYDLQHERSVHAKNGVAEDMLTLYYVEQHYDDLFAKGEKDAKVEYFAKISCKGAQGIDSELLELPQVKTETLIYERSDYDDTFATDDAHPKSGETYKAGTGIKELQQILITAGFLDIKAPNGSYGPKTEAAVKAFQECALGKNRKQKDKIVEVAVTFAGKSDGITEEKTQEELKVWSKEGYKKPGSVAAGKLTGSVGKNSENKAEDVKLVKERLKELGYPGIEVNEVCCEDTIKAIKFFQSFTWKSEIGNQILPDGQISKGKSTELALFGNSGSKYSAPVKGTVKTKTSEIQKKIAAASGVDKATWDKIVEVWDEVSPYLPAGSYMTSGYRTENEQRSILHAMYNDAYSNKLKDQYGEEIYNKLKSQQQLNDTLVETEMCKMLKNACKQDIAVPGKSKHNSGKAIDIGGQNDDKQVEVLRWYSVQFYEKKHITRIFKEKNGCVHFEFE